MRRIPETNCGADRTESGIHSLVISKPHQPDETRNTVAEEFVLEGRVQGLGVRPSIARLATRLGLCGYAANTPQGVKIHLEGPAEAIIRFRESLSDELPPAASCRMERNAGLTPCGYSSFEICKSEVSGAPAVDVPVDLAMCQYCAKELTDISDRRLGYAFSSCTCCGPRYSIVQSMPWERHDSTMNSFALCARCLSEFRNPDDRRFHAQTIACPECGPQISLRIRETQRVLLQDQEFGLEVVDPAKDPVAAGPLARSTTRNSNPDKALAGQANLEFQCPDDNGDRESRDSGRREGHNEYRQETGVKAIRAAAEMIRGGGLIALKGIGGYQLLCDATSEQAVRKLRLAKRRPSKPLVVMVMSHECLQRDESAQGPSATERTSLNSPVNPVVILDSVSLPQLAASVRCGLNSTGVMLPTTPLHALLLHALRQHTPSQQAAKSGQPVPTVEPALVVTSLNNESDPIVYHDDAALKALHEHIDGWLIHDRSIERPVDDSVIRVIAGNNVSIRAARGLAPMRLPLTSAFSLLAVGGDQKVACAISNGRQAVLGPHLGDMSSIASRERFTEQAAALQQLYQVQPTAIAHDLHPDYFTTRWAAEQCIRTIPVQHHHAHIVSGMLQHGVLDQTVLGVAFDGTGYGTDGTIWGGEFLLSNATDFRRVASLQPFLLPGGEAAVREPWRIAVSLLLSSFPEMSVEQLAEFLKSRFQKFGDVTESGRSPSLTEIRQVYGLVRAGHGIKTSSMGRLFDGIGCIVLGLARSGYESELPMRLEEACGSAQTNADWCLLTKDRAIPFRIDWRPVVRQIVEQLRRGCMVSELAQQFHLDAARMVLLVAEQFPGYPVVLSGGCFQNRILTEAVAQLLRRASRTVLLPGAIPPGDGGLAAGQLAIAAARLADSGREYDEQIANREIKA